MIHAKDEDFDNIMEIVYSHKKWFGHIRTDYIRQMIMNNSKKFNFISNFTSKNKNNNLLIYERDVILSYLVYRARHKIGTARAQKGDCILQQIGAKNKNGSASDVLQRFFKFINRRVFLSVRSDNEIARKFYLKNNMKLVGTTAWARHTIPGDVYLYNGN